MLFKGTSIVSRRKLGLYIHLRRFKKRSREHRRTLYGAEYKQKLSIPDQSGLSVYYAEMWCHAYLRLSVFRVSRH